MRAKLALNGLINSSWTSLTWCSQKGHIDLKKPAGLVKHVWPFCGQHALKRLKDVCHVKCLENIFTNINLIIKRIYRNWNMKRTKRYFIGSTKKSCETLQSMKLLFVHVLLKVKQIQNIKILKKNQSSQNIFPNFLSYKRDTNTNMKC